MENDIGNLLELEEFDDNLSFRDLPLHDAEEAELNHVYRNSVSDQDFSFEISTIVDHSDPEMQAQFEDIMFPRRIAKRISGSFDDREMNSLFAMNSPRLFRSKDRNTTNHNSSSAFSNSISRASSTGMGSRRHVSSARASAGKKHGVLIGLARVPMRMELGEIKKRQRKRPPPPMFPVAGVDGGDGAGRRQTGLLGTLRHRSLLLTLLAKASHGCIPRV